MASSSSFGPSSSSPTKKKTSKLSPIQKPLFEKPNSSSSSPKATSLTKRQETVFRKAEELSILCGIEVCVIYYGPDGELKTWPEDREKVKDIARRYSGLSEKKRRRGSVDLFEFLDQINQADSKKKNNKKKIVKKVNLGSNNKYPDWNPRFEKYSEEQLEELAQSLESKQAELKHRVQAAAEPQKQNMNMAYHQEHRIPSSNTMVQRFEQRRPSSTTMNHHLPQHSNQVPMYLFNHGDGTYSQIPVSAFNQSQSLPPFPTPLTVYPNPNAENYSSSLGAQETVINGVQNMNMNMFTDYNNNGNVNGFPKQISDGDGYLGLPGVQGTGVTKLQETNMYSCNNINVEDFDLDLLGLQDYGVTNELQNMNMYGGYNNNSNPNDLSQQLYQFPTQTAPPDFQFGSFWRQY